MADVTPDQILAALGASPFPAGVFTLSGDFVWCTESYVRTLGWEGPPIGQNVRTLADPAQNIPFFAAFDAVCGGESEQRVRNDSGDYGRVFDNVITRFADLVVVEITDVTSEVREQSRRRATESALESVFASTNDVIIVSDFVEGTVRANAAAQRYYGDLDWLRAALQDPDMDVHALPTDAFPFEDPDATMADELVMTVRAWESGVPQHVVGPIATLLGTRIMDRTISRWGAEGVPRGIVIVKYDVTDLLTQQAANERLQVRLDYARRMQRFAQGMAHDFGNVAQVVDGYARVLEANPSEETARSAGAGLAGAATRAVAVSRRIATIARLEQVPNTPIDIADMVRSHRAVLLATVPSGVDVTYSLPDRARAIGNAEVLEGAIENLVANAVFAMSGEGRIDISVTAVPDGVLLEVRDNGPGIPTDVRDRLFEPFASGHESRGAGGTGLGLFLLREYLQSVNGDVTWRSDDAGTRFTIRLAAQ